MAQALWPIFRIHHPRSRYVYEMCAVRHAITRELYDFCVKQGVVDAALVAKWKKEGYERAWRRGHCAGACTCYPPCAPAPHSRRL